MDLHSLKSRLQQHLSDGLVIIIGSGLSCAEGLPGMSELAAHLISTIGPGLSHDDQILWDTVKVLIRDKGLESALLEKPPSAALELAIVESTASIIRERERIVVSEVFAGKRELRLTKLLTHLLKPSSGLPIITTNYDRLVEIAVEEGGIGADTMFYGRFAGTLNERESRLSFCRNITIRKGNARYEFLPRALICKPHGSIDWYLRGGRPVSYAGDIPNASHLIIIPGYNKFRNGYESPFDHHRSRANDAIDRASRFLILGYGFNDDHLQTHLTPAIISGKPTLLLTHSLSPGAEALAIGHSNVMALDYAQETGIEGTRVIISQAQEFFPHLNLWDVNSFITEVLEP